jgi:hypothetical protein
MLPTMIEPSPERGIFRWVHYHAVRDRAKFWVGSVTLAGFLVVLGTQVALPPHPTTGQRIVNGLVTLGVAAGALVAGTYLYALVAAPYQQRNALRRMFTSAQASITALEAEPVGPSHAAQLRQVAARVKRSIEMGQVPAYRTPGYNDQELWRSAFFEHFPGLRSQLEIVEFPDKETVLLRQKVMREVGTVGMATPPWCPDEFGPIITDVINRRAMSDLPEGPMNFNWVQAGSSVYLDDPMQGPRILSLTDPAEDITKYKKAFEEFFRAAERWPEARAIRPQWMARSATAAEINGKLDVIAHTETFTTRCVMCRKPKP